MNVYKLLFSLIATSVVFLSCSKDNTNSTGIENDRVYTKSDSSLLINTTFEDVNGANLQGWQYGDATSANYFQYSNDVDSTGGMWSLKVLPDSTFKRFIYYRKSFHLTVKNNISFSYKLKTIGNIGFGIDYRIWSHLHNYGSAKAYSAFDNWTTIKEDILLSSPEIDSVYIYINGYGKDKDSYALVDNIRVEYN
jgi:hypothetical protein